jgi:hypothetical protein
MKVEREGVRRPRAGASQAGSQAPLQDEWIGTLLGFTLSDFQRWNLCSTPMSPQGERGWKNFWPPLTSS